MDPVKHMYLQRQEELIAEACKLDYYRPNLRFRASELTDCPRRIYHRLAGDRPLPQTPRLGDYGKAGDAAQDITRQQLVDNGVPVGGVNFTSEGQIETAMGSREFEYDGEVIDIAARTDGLLSWYEHNGILEIKSVGYWKYDAMCRAYTSKGVDGLIDHITKKHLNYIWQVEASMRILGESEAYLLFYDRSEARIGVRSKRDDDDLVGGFWINADDARWEAILRKLARIQKAIKRRAPVRPGELPGSVACQRCPFSYACHDAIERRAKGIEPAVVYPYPLEGSDE